MTTSRIFNSLMATATFLAVTSAAQAAGKLNVIAATEDLASLAAEVGGDHITVESIARGYQDPHFVEPKPSFLLKLQKADLLAVVGLQLEIGWLPPLITQSRNSKIQVGNAGYLDMSQFCEILEIPQGQVTRAEGDVHPLGNPHYWLNPENGRRIAKAFQNKFSEMRPEDASYFAGREADFEKRLTDAEKRWDAQMAPYRGRKVVTYHRSWPEFRERFGLVVVDYVEPKPGIPPTPSHTLEVINTMKRDGIKLILVEPYFDLRTPNSIAQAVGGTAVVLLPSVGGVKEVTDYFKLFDYDINLLATNFAKVSKDMNTLEFLLAPFVASLILTGIHAYLGVHVVERGVVFVDLSLAQIAALGTTIAVLSGYDPHGRGAYWMSLAFTFIGAAVFSTIKAQKARIPQEAIIGISYAVASAAAILAMSKSIEQTEHLKEMLVGNILTVSWDEVRHTALIYGAIGLFHYLLRKKFLLISMDPEKAEAQGVSVRFWDFLFYASFGFVVTSSVAIAGVLLVFCYLIVPSVGAMLFAQRIGPRLAIGWIMGTLVSALGVYLSLIIDLPTGATIVCTFGIALILMAVFRVFTKRSLA